MFSDARIFGINLKLYSLYVMDRNVYEPNVTTRISVMNALTCA